MGELAVALGDKRGRRTRHCKLTQGLVDSLLGLDNNIDEFASRQPSEIRYATRAGGLPSTSLHRKELFGGGRGLA